MLAEAARLWNLQVADLEGSDPLLHLLTGACAQELEGVYQELQLSRSRVINRLAAQLTPSTLTGPIPAHAVAMGSSIEYFGKVSIHDQLLFPAPLGSQLPDFYLAPAGEYSLVQGTIAFLAAGNNLWELLPSGKKGEQWATSSTSLPVNSLWIGMRLPAELEADRWLRLYFDWKNDPYHHQLQKLLRASTWTQDGRALAMEVGLDIDKHDGTQGFTAAEKVHQAGKHIAEVIAHVKAFYEHGFVNICGLIPGEACPGLLADSFPMAKADAFDAGMTWVQVQLPDAFPAASLQATACSLNAFPVVNLELHRKTIPLNRPVNIYALPCEHPFFEIHQVHNTDEQAFEPESSHKSRAIAR